MQHLLGRAGAAVEPGSTRHVSGWKLIAARSVFWLLALLTLAALALQLGIKQTEFKFSGPFGAETNPPQASLILGAPQQLPAPWWRQPLLGDNGEKPLQSFLELRINGRRMGPPHTLHDIIRSGTTTGFSHWGDRVIFALPPGVKNDAAAVATLQYSVRPRTWVTAALAILTAMLGCFAYSGPLGSFANRFGEQTKAVALRAPYWILAGLCGIALAASAAFVIASLYALTMGYALPTTALIRWSPIARWVASNEPLFGYPLLMLAGLGAATSWSIGSNASHQSLVGSYEQSLRRLLVWCGFPIVACAFVFCISAMWAGVVRPGDPNVSNMGGLLPFSDANGYLTAAFDQMKDGTLNAFALRRPLAAAFRSVLLIFSNLSLQSMMILQACLLAGAICFATHAIIKWRGIWAGITFLALSYIYDRYFVATTLTEPQGMFWAFLSIPFFIRAFRARSVGAALVAFAMTVVALMTRMGSMFAIPALVVWLVWQFGHGTKAKLKIGVAAFCIVLSVLGLNSLLQRIYAAEPGSTTGNFAYVLCGLSMGTTWDGCLKKLAAEGTPVVGSDDAMVRQLYAAAWDKFRANPGVLFRRLAESAEEFVATFPGVLWRGYGWVNEPDWLARNVLTAISLVGLLYGAIRRVRAIELTFWAILWASIVASSAFIYFDDGARALAASHPMMALFFALGMSGRTGASTDSSSYSPSPRNGFIGLVVATALLVGFPWAAHRLSSEKIAFAGTPSKQDEALVFGGRRISGFLVVKDDQPLRADVPTVHFADFAAMVAQSGLEYYQGLIHPIAPPLPFGFVFAPRIEKGYGSEPLYIVPPEVVERRDVPAWLFNLKPWGRKDNGAGTYWLYVTKAQPSVPTGR
ncbi:hypothetical protein [Bradyrhizobium elkanii]|uniref:Glycosyltransferase RgtA/B/C/D-like domain-containing protein n=1 Tax=Bradyrhizobium elkanii TaxID=29448 RepID=A0ABV4F5M5_BRAEL|nr:hypothetical protein [Bradyrhizobium elkanii]MCP1750173.1 hypothetical protein [Bradyrhizobium elkanii]MCP1984746.1 hypothetical protein [Bradyrhizobium elkanii]MCS3693142.1 hypothetical protein [Bradyrhizobium elkanii]MCS3889535.1 hypothetical protein [Bradyrhizobium elkanii]MCS4211444.1 hypothetical protein [Bradyrhizobium elkanii]